MPMRYWNNVRNVLSRIWGTLFPSAPGDPTHRHWSDHLIRRARYHILWSFAAQTAYRGQYGDAVCREFGAYEHIRPLYNVCGRIVEFHVAHLMGGILDPDAGDGKTVPNCLPILPAKGTDEGAIRTAVGSIWAASNWQVKKSLFTRYGAALGDAGIEVIADEARRLIRLRVVHPGEIEKVTKDAYGNVRGYTLSRWEIDPEDPTGDRISLYREVCVNDGGVVRYTTTKDGSEYPWPGTEGYQWESNWGFVPLVLVQHIDSGGDWGTAEIQNALFKTVERDGAGSNLSDQALKAVNGPWFLTGASMPGGSTGVSTGRSAYNGADPFAQDCAIGGTSPNLSISMDDTSTDIPIITCNAPDARMTPLVFPVPIAEVDAHIRTIADSQELDYPELQVDSGSVAGDASAKALREIKKKINRKVGERRASYDHALVHALQMGMTMGGVLGFPDFAAFDEGSFAAGKLAFQIGSRPVFDSDPLDQIEEEQARSVVVKTYVDAGVPMDEALLKAGWSREDVDRTMAAKATADDAAIKRLQDRQRIAMADVPVDMSGNGDGGGDGNGGGPTVGAGANANGFGGQY